MKHRGFTLVELLIVIVVIGVLSAMMMLSSTEAVSSAKANNVISNMRNIKTATLAWYADNLDKINAAGHITINGTKKFFHQWKDSDLGLSKYLNAGSSIKLNRLGDAKIPDDEYAVFAIEKKLGNNPVKINGDTDRSTWYIGYKIPNGDSKLKEKLQSRASSLGLHFSNDYPDHNVKAGYYVWMKIMGDWTPPTAQ